MEVYAVQDFRDALHLVDDELGGMLCHEVRAIGLRRSVYSGGFKIDVPVIGKDVFAKIILPDCLGPIVETTAYPPPDSLSSAILPSTF